MRPGQERWRQIERIYHAALEHPPSKRGAFVAGECKDDEELRREVESLLGKDAAPREELIDRPAWEGARDLLTTKAETQLPAGTQLGPYRVEQLIGSGGMGRVYRARDIRLGRAVAIKVSSEEFTGRFEREARAISALAHPHICTLFDVGPNYLVMELVEGESMADRDGKELFYVAADGTLTSAAADLSGRKPVFGAPASLFKIAVPAQMGPSDTPYDVAPDGRILALAHSG